MNSISRRPLSESAVLLGAILMSLIALTGCGGHQYRKVKFPYHVIVTVDPQMGVIKEHQVVYLLEGGTIEWKAPKGEKFSVEFDPKNCPFESCPVVDNASPQSPKGKHFEFLSLFKYTITVDGKSFDPHVVGGGGHG